jgi:inner membrane protein
VNTLPPLPEARSLLRNSITVRMVIVALMVLALMIPLAMVRGVLSDRLAHRNRAVADITSSWGQEQRIAGPFLVVPYRYQVREWRQASADGRAPLVEVTNTLTSRAFFLPASVKIDGDLDTETRRRGIYDAVVYAGRIRISGAFAAPDLEALKIRPEDVAWEDAILSLMVTDLRGARTMLEVKVGDRQTPLLPGTRITGFPAGLHAELKPTAPITAELPFEMEITLNGSKGIEFAPVGTQNEIALASPWPDPSFRGAFLPVSRDVTAQGFKALWQVSYYGRSYPPQWTERDPAGFSEEAVRASVFGVDFITAVDAYRNVERSIKYGALFITLVFTSFFLFEILASLRIHVFQYTLVGAALVLFYLLLLSITEFIAFPLAYAMAAVASAGLVSLYCLSVLRSGKRTSVIAGVLAAVYGFLYVTLQLQDFSLLFGSIGLFVVLAAVMYATRNIDWYAAPRR